MRKWFHAIGASGKATANVAKMFKELGWFVTGSDNQLLPPASLILEEADIPCEAGYHFSHLNKEFWDERLNEELDIPEHPDLCLIVDTATKQNKEYLYAKKLGVDVRPFAQILGEYLVKPESIVIVGSAGKTTTTSLLTISLQNLGLNPSYMIGADVIDLESSIENTESAWSVLEGDEFYGVEVNHHAKFLDYKPKYLVITKISWEHQDVFPTQESYIEEFAKVVRVIPYDGLIVAKYGDKNIDKALEDAKCKVIRYSLFDVEAGDEEAQSRFLDSSNQIWKVVKGLDGIHKIFDQDNNFVMDFETSLLGDYNLENILATIALISNLPAASLPIDLIESGTQNFLTLKRAIKDFKGPKKRLEILVKHDDLIVIDDFGVVPERAENSLKTISENFPHYEITAIFEPNSGSRPKDLDLFNKIYANAFLKADEVIIPDLSTMNSDLVQSEEMVSRLVSLGFNAKFITNENLENYLRDKYNSSQKAQLFIFFSSYRLTGIAHEFIKLYS